MQIWLLYVLGAVLAWGSYGPALHAGQSAFPDRQTASLRSLLCVGIAYFLVGVLVPLAALWNQAQLSGFNTRGTVYSTLGGVLGALGAVCIIWAFKNGGTPLYVMPLVFAGAPVVNVLITMASHPPHTRPHPLLFVGFMCAAAGAWLVLRYKPA
jgi:uncharacterized membrane protein HdeD (DUF308 family)